MMERQAVLALGSNLGDRQDILQGGVDAIAGIEGVRLTGVSPVYESCSAATAIVGAAEAAGARTS